MLTDKDNWAYLAVRDIDSDDLADGMTEKLERIGTNDVRTSEAMDGSGNHVAMFSPLVVRDGPRVSR
jgi:hypothetical protein